MAQPPHDPQVLALRVLVLALGAVATGAGLHSAASGDGSLPGGRTRSTRADSELRYYGVFYAAYGVAALRTGMPRQPEPRSVRALSLVLFAGGLARANGWRTRRRPHAGQVALLAAELGVPPVMAALAASG